MLFGSFRTHFYTARGFAAGPWAAIALFGLALAVIVTVLIELREDAIADVHRDLDNLALVMAAQTEALVEPIDLALREVQDAARTQATPEGFASFALRPTLHEKLRQRQAQLRRPGVLAIVDVEGRIVASSLSPSGAMVPR